MNHRFKENHLPTEYAKEHEKKEKFGAGPSEIKYMFQGADITHGFDEIPNIEIRNVFKKAKFLLGLSFHL